MPPALVFRHPGFLRACHGVRAAGGVFLHLVAFDLARGADGDWRVVGTARRRRRAPATRSRTASSSRACFPTRSASCASTRCRRSSATLQADAARRRAVDGERAARRAAHARAVQRDLLRARLPRALSRLPAGRGRRPDRARRSRLPEDGRRPAAGPRDPPPARRRLLRSARAALRLGARRARASCRRGAPGTCSSPTRSAWACSSRRRCSRSCRRSASGCSASRSRCRRSPPGGAARPRRSTTPRRRLADGVIKPAFADASMEPVFVVGPRRRRAPRMGRAAGHRRPTPTSSRSSCRCRTRRSGTTGASRAAR